ncbi:MAG: hypothetical protein K5905_23065 [Roseibium sp.]|uniref:hypothetical protein n=1 Tax=Roseibium sp. TaxID=1936156 RepID=UPI00260C5BEA|nr:hypothetical protein [Roseibium sp.]MCV0428348.1 hypothetical protein [Roseibium sp.]
MKDLFGEEIPDAADAETAYVPFDWVDEYCPLPVEDPASFCRKDPDGSWHLRPVPEDGMFAGKTNFDLVVEPGEVVKFSEHRSYPDVALTVYDDRTYSVFPFVPEDANCFLLDEPDLMTVSIEDLIAGSGDASCEVEPGSYSLTNYHWSGPVAFEFSVENGGAPDERPQFRRLGAEH